jgi:ribosomal protein S18 acetylase RimI-like enzyme
VRNIRDHLAGKHGAEVFLAPCEGRNVGTFCLEWQDHDGYWDDRGDDGAAGYLYTIAVPRDLRGQRIGEQMLAWAEDHIASRGRTFARLDCWCKNDALIAYYERLGYSRAGAKEHCQLFEKRVRA